MIYRYTYTSHQALLVHRPRMATLRPRTRVDRHRTLQSDMLDQKLRQELSMTKSGRPNKKIANAKDIIKRDSNRPFIGLTQVNKQIRQEYRPLYLQKQETGLDLTETVKYLQTFYGTAPAEFLKIMGTRGTPRGRDMPFTGNLTIAVGDTTKAIERAAEGVEIIPLLDIWANSYKIEAGFGRYNKNYYNAPADGEAKDL